MSSDASILRLRGESRMWQPPDGRGCCNHGWNVLQEIIKPRTPWCSRRPRRYHEETTRRLLAAANSTPAGLEQARRHHIDQVAKGKEIAHIEQYIQYRAAFALLSLTFSTYRDRGTNSDHSRGAQNRSIVVRARRGIHTTWSSAKPGRYSCGARKQIGYT